MIDARKPYYICLESNDGQYTYNIRQLSKPEFFTFYSIAKAISRDNTSSVNLYPLPDLMTLYDNYELNHIDMLTIDDIPYEHYDKHFELYIKTKLFTIWERLKSK